jgi:hypothetical protein
MNSRRWDCTVLEVLPVLLSCCHHAGSVLLLSTVRLFPILCLWWRYMFMSGQKLTNFASFLCRFFVEVRGQSGLHTLALFYPDLEASFFIYIPHADSLRTKVLTFLPPLIPQTFRSDDDGVTGSSVTLSICH